MKKQAEQHVKSAASQVHKLKLTGSAHYARYTPEKLSDLDLEHQLAIEQIRKEEYALWSRNVR